MKGSRDLRSIVVVLLLVAAVTVAVVALGCFGGGQNNPGTTQVTGGNGGAVGNGDGSTTMVAATNQLSSFKSKDPFIPQAQATTTIAPASTTIRSTTSSSTPTTRVTTSTTAPHRLQVTAIPASGDTVSFTLDGYNLTGFGAGPALFNGPWGSIQIVSINDTVAPYTASFRLNGSIDFTLRSGQSRTW
jgi:hypothetical protein